MKLKTKKGSQERRKAWGVLINEDFQQKYSVLQSKKGVVIPKYRSGSCDRKSTDLVPSTVCKRSRYQCQVRASLCWTDQSTDSGEWPSVETKRAKIEQRQKKVTRVYKIGLRPTKEQRKVLNDCIVVANRAYNLCIELVESKVCQPNQFDLQKMVVKKKECTGEDAWFWNSSTVVRLLATKSFCSAVKAIN
ncbi:hypothetical protein BaRGS_00020210 [Batillaria attramentaria]|uniref:Transposase putative helix-turn-helix domain-containing protein n=1 Tax=Batillaria attramentaria TaxID=370345 RepID=A0ABD0KNW4_9CAEN